MTALSQIISQKPVISYATPAQDGKFDNGSAEIIITYTQDDATITLRATGFNGSLIDGEIVNTFPCFAFDEMLFVTTKGLSDVVDATFDTSEMPHLDYTHSIKNPAPLIDFVGEIASKVHKALCSTHSMTTISKELGELI